MGIKENISRMFGRISEEEKLYQELMTEKYGEYPYERKDWGEDMSLIKEVIWQYWKPRYLLDHREKKAVVFMDGNEDLVTVTKDDIDWKSLEKLPDDVVSTAKALSFHYPSFIYPFQNGRAEVQWQLNPDGRYYMDEDGYGMTDDVEVNIYGYIDRAGKVVEKFKHKGD